jgi:hypothetical protein
MGRLWARLWRDYVETTARIACATRAIGEGITDGLMIFTWRPPYSGLCATHRWPGTSVADDARRLDCAQSLLGVQSRIPGSAWVHTPRVVPGGSAAVLKVRMQIGLIVPPPIS